MKKDRLLSRGDFSAVFDASHKPSPGEKLIYHHEPYIVYQKSGPTPRLGLSIPRRIVKKATERNRIKRCLREFFRNSKEDWMGDFVIRLVSRPKDEDFTTLVTPLRQLLERRISSSITQRVIEGRNV